MNIKYRMIMDEFREEKPAFDQLGELVHDKLNEIAKSTGVLVNSIEHRVKEEKSLEGKLYRKGDSYNTLSDLTDILGARIICYFNDDIDVIGKAIEESFIIDWENSQDKRALMRADSFGYLSLHYICSLKEDQGHPEELTGKKFEIQIRTILQHAWSDINHDLGYKTEFGVPRTVTREFARLAGLLEIADDEFVRVRNTVKNYTEEIREKIVSDNAQDVLLDIVSLNEYMKGNKKINTFIEQMAAIEGSEIMYIEPDSYIQQFEFLGINTIGKLQQVLEANEHLAMALARDTLEGTELDILSSNVALRFICRAYLLTGGFSEEQVTDFIQLTVNKRDRAEKQAKRLFKVYKKIKKADEERLEAAREYAAEKHKGQTRKGGEPYITHPIAVAEILREKGYDEEYQLTGLFHDLLEDTDATEEEILKLGSPQVLEAVKLLTKEGRYIMADYIAGIKANAMAKEVKAADRLHNLRSAVVASESFKKKYILETLEWYMDFSPEIPQAVLALAETMEEQELLKVIKEKM